MCGEDCAMCSLSVQGVSLPIQEVLAAVLTDQQKFNYVIPPGCG